MQLVLERVLLKPLIVLRKYSPLLLEEFFAVTVRLRASSQFWSKSQQCGSISQNGSEVLFQSSFKGINIGQELETEKVFLLHHFELIADDSGNLFQCLLFDFAWNFEKWLREGFNKADRCIDRERN